MKQTFREFLEESMVTEAKISTEEAARKLVDLQKSLTSDNSNENAKKVAEESVPFIKAIFKVNKVSAGDIGYMAVPKHFNGFSKGTFGTSYDTKPSVEKMIDKLSKSGALVSSGGRYGFSPEVKQAMWFFTHMKISDDMLTTFKADKAYDRHLRASF